MSPKKTAQMEIGLSVSSLRCARTFAASVNGRTVWRSAAGYDMPKMREVGRVGGGKRKKRKWGGGKEEKGVSTLSWRADQLHSRALARAW